MDDDRNEDLGYKIARGEALTPEEYETASAQLFQATITKGKELLGLLFEENKDLTLRDCLSLWILEKEVEAKARGLPSAYDLMTINAIDENFNEDTKPEDFITYVANCYDFVPHLPGSTAKDRELITRINEVSFNRVVEIAGTVCSAYQMLLIDGLKNIRNAQIEEGIESIANSAEGINHRELGTAFGKLEKLEKTNPEYQEAIWTQFSDAFAKRSDYEGCTLSGSSLLSKAVEFQEDEKAETAIKIYENLAKYHKNFAEDIADRDKGRHRFFVDNHVSDFYLKYCNALLANAPEKLPDVLEDMREHFNTSEDVMKVYDRFTG